MNRVCFLTKQLLRKSFMCAMSEHRERVPQENIIGLFTAKFKILLFKEQQQQQKKPLICSIVNFHGVSTLPLADFKSSM